MEKIYDLIIVGGGPAGITAAIYAARKKMDMAFITKDVGGQASWTADIENYSGFQFITGAELTAKFEEHIKKYGIKVNEGEELTGIKKSGGIIEIKTNKASYKAITVILATGKRAKELGVPGEKEFRNRGIAYCATCDGPLFAGKDVAVVGGGNSAMEAALQLIKIARHVYMVNIAEEFNADAVLVEKVKNSENVTIMHDARVTSIKGDKFVTGIVVQSSQGEREIPLSGVFVEIGLVPNTSFESDISRNEIGELGVNCVNETNISGIFAAGDVTNVPEKQIIIAAGEGAKAALRAFRYVAKNR